MKKKTFKERLANKYNIGDELYLSDDPKETITIKEKRSAYKFTIYGYIYSSNPKQMMYANGIYLSENFIYKKINKKDVKKTINDKLLK
jgi:hypothetical protein